MTIPSNLYAEKVFAEQPLALWSFDEEAYFGSLIPSADRDLSTWSKTGGTLESSSNIISPITGEQVFRGLGVVPLSTGYTELKSAELFNLNDLTGFYGQSFSIGLYVYLSSPYISSIDIGYEENSIEHIENIPISLVNQWVFISNPFNLQSINNVKIIFRINYISGGATNEDYEFYLSSASCGQWSEEFSAASTGLDLVQIPDDIDIQAASGVIASAYGMQNLDAYYMADGKSLVAKNSGVPLVYGASSVTSIIPVINFGESGSSKVPSIIVPGLGFLNEYGKFNDYTTEFWLRINPNFDLVNDIDEFRIFGPINSKDGIYVSNSTISIRVGTYSGIYSYSDPYAQRIAATPYIGSYSVGEWNRPMLIDFKLSENLAALSINGETVISIDIDMTKISFGDRYVSAQDISFLDPADQIGHTVGKNQDWLGFYGSAQITPFQIDCVAIYPYIVSDIVAKRRFVYGQGVEFPENLNTAYSGTSIYSDFSFSKYSNSYNYPEIGAWNQGILENFVTDKKTLSLPQYELPEISFNNKSFSTWNDLSYFKYKAYVSGGTKISLYPDLSWLSDNTQGYIYFKDLLLSGNSRVAGLFANLQGGSAGETVFYIKDKNSSDYFEVSKTISGLKYEITTSGNTIQITEIETANTYVGLDILTFSSAFGGEVYSFFSRSSLSLYVGGRPDYTKTFTGEISSIGLCSSYNLSRISNYFNINGIMETDIIQKQDYFATYQLHARIYMGAYRLSIATSSYWEDYVPLTTLATYVTNTDGDKVYDLDYIQINTPSSVAKESKYHSHYIGESTWGDIVLDEDIMEDHDSSFPIRTYISFKYNDTSLEQDLIYYRNAKNRLLDLSLDDKWLNSKYEVFDGTVIYPPSGVDINNLSIVVRIEGTNESIYDYPVVVKSLQLASKSLSSAESNPIGTRFGNDIYPYKKSGIYYDYAGKTPVTITKGTTPYLYLTEKSGIEVVGDLDISRGISIPINANKSLEYNMIGLQSFIKLSNYIHKKSLLPSDQGIELFEIISKNKHLKFYMSPVINDMQYPGEALSQEEQSYKRSMIYCLDADTGLAENGISYFWNGRLVKNPIITANEWGVLGVGFFNAIDLSNYSGQLNITGPIMFDSLSHYGSTNLQELQKKVFNNWLSVNGMNTIDWNHWLSSYTWDNVLAVMTNTNRSFSLADVYNAYVGTNKLVIADSDELTLGSYEYTILTDSGWQTFIESPV